MVLVVGAGGRLGGRIARGLIANGEHVRALAREPEHLRELRELGADVVEGDLLRPSTVTMAAEGCREVVTTANGGGLPPALQVVDREGNANLIEAAIAAGAQRFIFLSARSADPKSPVDIFRWKWETEQRLRRSGLDYTILRPTHLLDTWIELLAPGVRRGRVTLFGKGTNPVSFVAGGDVARAAVSVLRDRKVSGRVLEVGGPVAVSLTNLVDLLEVTSGRRIRRRHIPLPLLRAGSRLLWPWRPVLARQLSFAHLLESADQVSHDQSLWDLNSWLPRTSPLEFITEWLAQSSEIRSTSESSTRAQTVT